MTYCDECTMKPYCVARLNDNTITGCNILLFYRGLISKEEVVIEHTVKGGDGMTTQEVKDYYGDTPEQFCRILCKSCTSNDWYCPTLCNELEWVMRNFEKAVERMAKLDGDEVKFSQGLKRWKG